MKFRKRLAVVLAAALCACVIAPAAGLAASDEAHAGYYIVDNGGVPQTCRAFLAGIALEEGQSAVLTRAGDVVADGDFIATNDKLTTYDYDIVADEETLVVMGDVLGTGMASMTQLTRIAQALYGGQPLEGAYAVAADLSGSGQLDLSDLVDAAKQYVSLQGGAYHKVEAMDSTCYMLAPGNEMPVTLYYVDGQRDIPYIELEDMIGLLEVLLGYQGVGEPPFATEHDGPIMVVTRDNGSVAEIDFANDTIAFSNFNAFTSQPFATTSLDVLGSSGFDADGDLRYFTRPAGSFERTGLPILLDLQAHGILAVMDEGVGYLPLQTFGDVFMAPMNIQLLYNGQGMFLTAGGNLGALEDLYYSAPTGLRSPELAEFSYNELCLALEMYYGLKEQHDIRSFDTLFQQTGLDEKLKSEDPVVADTALATLCAGYFADLHSGFLSASYLAGKDADVHPELVSPTIRQALQDQAMFTEARDAVYPDGAPGYQEVGNTAYVTFDHFEMPGPDVDYYTTPPGPDATDTVGIIMYAHSQIMREDSPIENVVIDLSANGGGQADAAVFVIGWYLGQAGINLNDTLTETQATTLYGVDVNADGTVDENDSVASKNLYCLISPNSFSCGNLVPAAFKGSNKVTLLGRASGGGACVVRPLSTADGSLLQISGPLRISSLSNGSYYDVDKGIDPDVPIVNVDNFYNREALSAYINGLFR